VQINDLDLNSARGAHTLFHRVNVVAGDLCAQTESALFPWAPDTERACRIKAVTRAISQLNSPRVNAEFVRVYGQRDTTLAAK
jgi:UrcA family protein